MILYVNSCVRESSRTDRLAREVISRLSDGKAGDASAFLEVRLAEESAAGRLLPLSRERLAKRDALIRDGKFDDPMFALARDFQAAEKIVVSAPFWDLSFPSLLKLYIENIYIVGLVTRYNPDGSCVGLCRAKKLYYVSTAGGRFVPDFGYDYIRDIATRYFGIAETGLVYAEMLDVEGSDAEAILRKAISEITL